MDAISYSRRRFGAATIGAAAIGAGAVAVAGPSSPATAQAAPSPWWFNVRDYGAAGNGTTDDTAAIQHTINVARLYGGGVVMLPAGTYKVSGMLRLTDDSPSATSYPTVSLRGVGPHASVIKVMPANAYPDGAVVLVEGRDGTKRSLARSLTAGTRSVTVPSGSAALLSELEVGKVVGFEAAGPAVFGGATAKPRELHRVVAIQGSTVTLDSPLLFGYDASVVAWRVFGPEGVTISDLSITCTDPLAQHAGAFSLRFISAADVSIERVTVTRAGGGIELKDVVDAHVTDTTVGPLPNLTQTPWGYGIIASGGTANVIITGLIGRHCRNVFTTLSDNRGGVFWGGPRDITIVGGIGEGGPGSAAIWSSHEFGVNIRFVGCLARGADTGENMDCPGFHLRARDMSVVDCVAHYCKGAGVLINTSASGGTVEGGELAYNGGAGVAANGVRSRVVGTHIHNNGTQGISLWRHQQDPAPVDAHVMGCHIHDNGKSGSNGYGIHDQTWGSTVLVVTGNVIPYASTQELSMLGLGSGGTPRVAISNNVLLGHGPGDLGDFLTSGTAIKGFNTVDPPT